ncbi:2436_t:CDS:2, partial [Entrophospora sp. SA101]
MNAFYGEVGNRKSSLFLRVLTVTGDIILTECNIAYKNGETSKEAYWIKMVEIIIKVIKEFSEKVNSRFERDNGTPRLKMAYKEPYSHGQNVQ